MEGGGCGVEDRQTGRRSRKQSTSRLRFVQDRPRASALVRLCMPQVFTLVCSLSWAVRTCATCVLRRVCAQVCVREHQDVWRKCVCVSMPMRRKCVCVHADEAQPDRLSHGSLPT